MKFKKTLLALSLLSLSINSYALDINYKNVALDEVVKDLSKLTKKNIAVKNDIDVNISINLKNVSFEQALDSILKTQDLRMIEDNNVIFISKKEDIKEIEQDTRTSTKYFKLKYSKASDIEKIINKVVSKEAKVSIDERTNTVVVQDDYKSLLKVVEIVNEIDVIVQQIQISARVVLTKDDYSKKIGAKINSRIGKEDSSNANFSNLMSISKSIALQFSSPSELIDLEIAAAQSEGQAEIIATPTLTTSNKEKASIQTGTKLPYQSANGEGITATQFKDAVMKLEVTPTITDDNQIMLELVINKDSAGTITNDGIAIDTTEIRTKVLVKNESTIVIGGIYSTDKVEQEDKIILLGDIPWLGRLFKNKIEVEQKKELLIFITPKIL